MKTDAARTYAKAASREINTTHEYRIQSGFVAGRYTLWTTHTIFSKKRTPKSSSNAPESTPTPLSNVKYKHQPSQ
jgi:hypothetical protein